MVGQIGWGVTEFNREPAGLYAYFIDGSDASFKWNSKNQFVNQWNNLDHPNLVATVIILKQQYETREGDILNYREVIFSNDDEYTFYWLDESGMQFGEGLSRDIPTGAHAYPKNLRASTIEIDNKAGDKRNFK